MNQSYFDRYVNKIDVTAVQDAKRQLSEEKDAEILIYDENCI